MKIFKIITVSFFLMILLQISGGISSAEASDYLGEFCWSLHVIEEDDGPGDETVLMRIGITHMGGSSYSMQGTVEVSDDNSVVINGSVAVIGNELFISGTGSQRHRLLPWRDAVTFQARLDPSTLNGTFWSNILTFDTRAREFDHSYSAGTATFTTCP